MNSTLVFCTSYIRGQPTWDSRYRRWLDYNRALFPDELLMFIDDGSPFLPKDSDVSIVEDLSRLESANRCSLFHFPDRLGRFDVNDFPGWFRSFTFSVAIARELELTKIVHIESDAFILSRKALAFINEISSGWTALWCPQHSFPETAIQVICADSFAALEEVGSKSFAKCYAGKILESTLPFTRVERGLYGDRFGEFRTVVPRRADYAGQVLATTIFRSDFGGYKWSVDPYLKTLRRAGRRLFGQSL